MERPAACDLYWTKQTFIIGRDFVLPKWACSHTLVPTPIIVDDNTVRIFSSFVDSDFVGRIAWIDMDYNGETFEVKEVSQLPYLEVGDKNSFSEFGTGLGCFWPRESPEYLAYIGFSRPPGFKFKAFSGLKKVGVAAVEGYTANIDTWLGGDKLGKSIVGIHDLIEINGFIYGFVSFGDDFEIINQKPYPKYQVGLMGGFQLKELELISKRILPIPKNVYRMGRPRAEMTRRGIELLVTAGTTDGRYFPLAYYSNDLKVWTEERLESFRQTCVPGFDDKQQCYLSRFSIQGKEFIVYNGNDMGRFGFGIATATSGN
jgi:hypothetical protein